MKRLFLVFALIGSPLFAVNPDEVLQDPALEARARAISQELRCVVCRGENIDESNAGVARDLRLLVRERLLEGDTDQAVVDYVAERYGEYVLMTPNRDGANLVLWAAGPVLFLIALIGGVLYMRRRARTGEGGDALSDKEQARLEAILKK
ncbi:MAG: cytochrome c-type biogenesis protein CcmH [Rhodobacteraceae bacterium]|nr:cytochrome c-type biogenesis protein CcmH [Paracoccaceae bacterium]